MRIFFVSLMFLLIAPDLSATDLNKGDKIIVPRFEYPSYKDISEWEWAKAEVISVQNGDVFVRFETSRGPREMHLQAFQVNNSRPFARKQRHFYFKDSKGSEHVTAQAMESTQGQGEGFVPVLKQHNTSDMDLYTLKPGEFSKEGGNKVGNYALEARGNKNNRSAFGVVTAEFERSGRLFVNTGHPDQYAEGMFMSSQGAIVEVDRHQRGTYNETGYIAADLGEYLVVSSSAVSESLIVVKKGQRSPFAKLGAGLMRGFKGCFEIGAWTRTTTLNEAAWL